MFRNPVFDLVVIVPALLITALLGFLVMAGAARAAETDTPLQEATATTTGGRAVTASTSGSTLPDPTQKIITITRAEAAVNDGWNDATITPLSVRTSSELLAYARATIREDGYMESISLSSRGITVSYQRAGRFLGFVPVAIPTKATVHTDGSVVFSEPWYGVVTLDEKDQMKTALEVRVHALLTSEGYLASMQLAPVTQAEILDIIRELLV